MKKTLLILVILAILAFAANHFLGSSKGGEDGRPTVVVARGSIYIDAVAVGTVEARFEVPVTATTGGVVTQKLVELGQYVQKGDPLFEVRPILTERQRLQAQRSLSAAHDAAEGVEEMANGETVAGWALWMIQGGKSMDRMQESAVLARSDAEAQLELLLNGQVEMDGRTIDFLVRSPIEGHVISEDLEVGEPVVQASTFGAGTVLVTLADLDHPVFRGTVDEIDVGRLSTGMKGVLTLGARPGVELKASLTEISLRAESKNNAVVFPVEMDVAPPDDLVLRSGYSAVANIRVKEVTDVLVLPERLIDFRDGKAFVLQKDSAGEVIEVAVDTGLSDGLKIEILSGLKEGDVVLERTY